jgi:hypothetical protein
VQARRARELWTLYEPVHAVTYFVPDCIDAFKQVGLKGFWMGYFGGRAAPMGAVGPGVVSATFYMFAPSMVTRAVPDAWAFADPSAILDTRRGAAANALRRLAPSVEQVAPRLVTLLGPAVEQAEGGGRVLFSANRGLGLPGDPVEALWQLTTCLREHRGDGHVAALCAHGLSGLEATVLFARSEDFSDEMFRSARGWTEEEWQAAADALGTRGLLGGADVTTAGRDLRAKVESTTDELAAALFAKLGETVVDEVTRGLGRVVGELTETAAIPYPNPVGLRSAPTL